MDHVPHRHARRPGYAIVPFAAAWIAAIVVGLLLPGAGDVSAQGKVLGRFSHGQHLELVKECTACHLLNEKTGWVEKRLVATGKAGNEHRPCSNNGCHANEWGQRRPPAFCWTCHQGTLARVKFPPFRDRGDSQFYLKTFAHKDHIREGSKGCEQCHSPETGRGKGSDPLKSDMVDVDHRVCGERICHGEKLTPNMKDCLSCHVLRAEGEAVAPKQSVTWNNFRTRLAYDHTDHAKKAGSNECAQCHTNVLVGAGSVVPLPEMITCEGCHNGTQAFPALGHACRRCHVVPEARP